MAIRAAAAAGVSLADIDVLATHQANLRIIEAIAQEGDRRRRPPGRQVARDIVTTGQHLVGVDSRSALDRMRATGEARSGDLVLAVGFGAGLTYRGPGLPVPVTAAHRCDGITRDPLRQNALLAFRRLPDQGITPPKGTIVSNEDILAGLGEIVEEVAGVSAADVTADKSFTDDLDIDSLSMVEIAVQAEDKFGVKIPDDELANLKTVGDAVVLHRTQQVTPGQRRPRPAAARPASGRRKELECTMTTDHDVVVTGIGATTPIRWHGARDLAGHARRHHRRQDRWTSPGSTSTTCRCGSTRR